MHFVRAFGMARSDFFLYFNLGSPERKLLTTGDTEDHGEKLTYLLIKLKFLVVKANFVHVNIKISEFLYVLCG